MEVTRGDGNDVIQTEDWDGISGPPVFVSPYAVVFELAVAVVSPSPHVAVPPERERMLVASRDRDDVVGETDDGSWRAHWIGRVRHVAVLYLARAVLLWGALIRFPRPCHTPAEQ